VLRGNGLRTEEGGVILGQLLNENSVLTELDVSANGLFCDNSGGDGPAFARGISEGLAGNGVISSVNLLKNSIGTDQAKTSMSILKEHPTLKSLCGNKGNETELDMSSKMSGTGDAIMLAAEIIDNGAISQFTFSGDGRGNTPVTMEIFMTEADFSAKGLGQSGAIMVAAFLPKFT
jgi:hypothetical protein